MEPVSLTSEFNILAYLKSFLVGLIVVSLLGGAIFLGSHAEASAPSADLQVLPGDSVVATQSQR